MLYRLYGLTLHSDLPFPELPEATGYPDITFRAGEVDLPGSAVPFFHSPLLTADNGLPLYTLCEAGATRLIHITNVATLAVSADASQVVYRVCLGASDELFRTWVLGTVAALLLEWRGTFCLHAGAAAVEGGCLAFAGFPRTGKSSLLAACVAAGWLLVTDDILPLTLQEDGILATPGYPGLKLWPDAVATFVGDPSAFPRIGAGLDKRRVTVGRGWGSFCSTPQPLRAVYIVELSSHGHVGFQPLSRRDATVALISHSFVDLARDQTMRIRQLDTCAAIATQVPVYNLHVPQDLAQLATVPDEIIRFNTELAGRS